ncbi:MAG: hypothetical protein M1431_06555 [Candidatus Thermoplasmatota archaeon]|nr:hypothetical protein [Candidatus Thermoplasmatota archaeon]
MKQGLLTMASLIFNEERYLGARYSRNYRSDEFNKSVRGRDQIKRLTIYNLITVAISYSFLSFIVAMENLGTGVTDSGTLLMALSIFPLNMAVNIYSSASYSMSLKNSRSPEIFNALPVSRTWIIFEASWFLSSGILSLFIVLPVSIVYCLDLSSFAPLFLDIAIWLSSTFLGFAIGFTFGSLSFLGKQGSRGFKKLTNVFRNSLLLLLFLAFFTSIYALPRLSSSPFFMNNTILQRLLGEFGAAMSLNFAVISPYFLFTATIFLLAGSLAASAYSSSVGLKRISRQDMGSASGVRSKRKSLGKPKEGSMSIKSIRKDMNLWLRQSFPSLLLFTPVFLVFPLSVNYILGITRERFLPAEFLMFILAASIISSFSYSMGSLISEGKGLKVLGMLPMNLGDLIRLKLISSSIFFVVCLLPVYIIVTYLSGIDFMDSAIFFATAVSAFMTAFLIASSLLYARVSESGWEVNMHGSENYAFLFYSYLIASIPAVLAAVAVFLTGYLYNSPESLEFFTYGTLNIGILALLCFYLVIKNNGINQLSRKFPESE